ncbi:shikimate kinase [Bacillus infantis]|uniref:Shikimate kinase n=1 Tax=Bacillus infantis TaxID=324767 RepID=A0A5D4QP94_9BACI|nr:shikimate kinase [Bacillus infantis]TYS40189.1 shikimate kinase [Bacillus infantis]
MNTIYLIGFMGAGKTTVGRELSSALGKPAVDMDEEIEKEAGISIKEMFAQEGEEYFRKLETQMLERLSARDIIVTTGGGVVLRKENRYLLKNTGTVLFLHASPEETIKRLAADTARPLLEGGLEQKVKVLYQSRLPLYKEAADHIIETDGRTIGSITAEAQLCLKS